MDRMEGRRRNIPTLLLVGTAVIVIAVTLFRVPLASVLGLGVLLICPLLMVGMHGGHGGSHHGEEPDSADHRGTDPVSHQHRPSSRPAGSGRDRMFDPDVGAAPRWPLGRGR